MIGMKDHVCSSQCMFCRVLENPQRTKQLAGRSQLDEKVLQRVKELEQRTLLTNTQATLTSAKGEELERLALLDSLTGLYNSRTLMKELREELKRAKRYKHPVSLCLVSIDGFKQITTQFGVLTSDAVLKVVANVIRLSIRDIDIAGRYGSDVFAIVLPETNASGAAVVAERMRQRIGTQAVTHNWHNLRVTASLGLASFPAHAHEYDELIARAIQALELSAERGGDRVCMV